MTGRSLAVAAVVVAVALAPHDAAAQAPPQATVLAIDEGELIVDLGSTKGAREGQVVELWRPLRVRHPVTGKTLTDRFRLGTIRLTQVQPTLSLAKVDGKLLRPPQAGDLVAVAEIEKAPAAPPPPPPPPATPPQEQRTVVVADPEAQALADLMVALEGADPATRANAYASFVRARPDSRFARVLNEEIAALRTPDARAFETSFTPIGRMRPGVPHRLAVELDGRFAGALVHVRRKGAVAYRSLAMESVGPRYFAATLPGDAIDEPGAEYFVEGVTAEGGRSIALIGSAEHPKEAPVDPRPRTGKKEGTLARVDLSSEYASFDARSRNDYLFQTEGTFGWRLRDEGIRAVRSGFGVLRGKGGTLRDLDELGLPPRSVGLTYGYVEAELGITKSYGLIARPILGLREGGVTGGAQGFVRVGSDLATNLLVGGEVLGTVGLRGIVQLEWRTIPRVPIMLRSEVTNQPAGTGGDVGARAIAQAGYELLPELTVSARASYQGRTIDHAGPGAGLGVSYQW